MQYLHFRPLQSTHKNGKSMDKNDHILTWDHISTCMEGICHSGIYEFVFYHDGSWLASL